MKTKPNAGLRAIIQEIAKTVLQERNLDVPSVDSNVIENAMYEPAVRVANSIAEHVVVDMETKLAPTLLKALNAHLIGVETPSSSAGPAWDADEIERIVETHDAEFAELQGACMEAVTNALVEYYKDFVSLVAHSSHDEGY